jgi:low molecular weight protein-tyrosine phosphatase
MSPEPRPHRILFVCLGNICRSPMAEGVFRRTVEEAGLSDRFEIESAGLGDWHIGQAPDERAQAAASARGLDISGQTARQVTQQDFANFDLLIAMDEANYTALQRLAPKGQAHRLRQFLDFAPQLGCRDVPDPFFGGQDGFDRALDLIEEASQGLLAALIGDEAASGDSAGGELVEARGAAARKARR